MNILKKDVVKKIIKKESSMFVLILIVVVLDLLVVRSGGFKPLEMLLLALMLILIAVLFGRFELVMNLLCRNYSLFRCKFVDIRAHSVGKGTRTDVLVELHGEVKKIPIRPSTAKFFRNEKEVLVIKSHNKEFVYSYKMFDADTFEDVVEPIL